MMQKIVLPKWASIVVGIVGVIALLNGISTMRDGMRESKGDNGTAQQQQQTVPGYGPASMSDPRARPVSTNGPAPMQQMPIAPANTSNYALPTATSNYPPQNTPQYEPQNRPTYAPQNAPNDAASNDAKREPSSSSGQRYRDPQGRFVIMVPDGWRAAANNGSVVIQSGSAFVVVLPFDGAASSEQVVGTLGQQYAKQWRDLVVVNQGQTMLSGAQGAYVMYRGINPKGVQALLRIVGASSGGQAWAIVIAAPMQEFNQVSSVLQQVEMSFTVGTR